MDRRVVYSHFNALPTPAAAKYNAEGEPSPPAPIIKTLACLSFNCPFFFFVCWFYGEI